MFTLMACKDKGQNIGIQDERNHKKSFPTLIMSIEGILGNKDWDTRTALLSFLRGAITKMNYSLQLDFMNVPMPSNKWLLPNIRSIPPHIKRPSLPILSIIITLLNPIPTNKIPEFLICILSYQTKRIFFVRIFMVA